jgi:hypothetical protein
MPDKTDIRPTFAAFYHQHFRPEHAHPANVALHGLGVIAGLAVLGLSAAQAINPWWAVSFPLVHVAPGLIGHRLFERNAAVGDLRLSRVDFPLWWFIIANHRLAWDVVTRRPR